VPPDQVERMAPMDGWFQRRERPADG